MILVTACAVGDGPEPQIGPIEVGVLVRSVRGTRMCCRPRAKAAEPRRVLLDSLVGLAPAAGLAPELPGSATGDLLGRQIWWGGTALATAGALWMFLRADSLLVRIAAVVPLLAPHVIGAPHLHAFESKVPAELAAQFTALSLVVQGSLWVLAGMAVGLLWPRISPKQAA